MAVFPIGRIARARKDAANKIAARVAAFKDSPPHGEGVVPLNRGFFLLERMRTAAVAKKKADRKKRAPQGR